MRKVMLSFLFAFLLFGMIFHSPIILADDNKTANVTTTSGGSNPATTTTTTTTSGSGDLRDIREKRLEAEKKLFENRQKFEENAMERLKKLNEKRIRIEEESLRRQFREEGRNVNITREVSIDSNGTKTITITKTKIDENGNVKTKVIQYIIGADGEKRIKIKSECEVEDGVEKCKVENEVENEIHTSLNISTEFENDSNLEVKTSDGEKHKLRVLPDEARQIIMERLKALNITNITLEEVKHKNIPRVIYNIESNKHGRFLGVFKLGLKVDSQVDPTTGEVLSVNKPWWGIFVVEQNENVPPATNTTTTVPSITITNTSA